MILPAMKASDISKRLFMLTQMEILLSTMKAITIVVRILVMKTVEGRK